MAPQKRRVDQTDRPVKGTPSDQDPPAKRLRKDTLNAYAAAKNEPKSMQPSSLLKEEKLAFPRGGGGPLTQLEHRQIQVQATRDALFEERGQDDAHEADGTPDEDADKASAQRSTNKKQRRSSQKSSGKEPTSSSAHPKPIRVEGFKAKHLQSGCLVLGQISRVAAHELILDLPNCLSGSVYATAISSEFTKRIKLLDPDEMDADADIDLRRMFSVGQYLRAAPHFEGAASKNGTPKKRLALTIDPRKVNGKLDLASLPVGSTIQASVASVEDHGLVMDLGIDDSKVRGFLDSKNIPKPLALADISEGTVFLCVVTSLSSSGKVVKLTANYQKPNDAKAHILSPSPTVDSVLPGTAVEILISQVDASGIAGTILGSLDAIADFIHSKFASNEPESKPEYTVGSKIRGRVIFAFVGEERMRVGFSLLDHILQLERKVSDQGSDPAEILGRSEYVDDARIVNAEPSLGLFATTGVAGVTGFVHISRVADDRVDTLPKSTGPYKISTVHRARVLDYNSLDGLFIMSMQPDVLRQPFLRLEDINVGELVKAKVQKIILKGGMVLELANGITGFVPEMHISDTKLSDPTKKFKRGAAVTARVLSVDLENRNVHLSLRKSLLADDLEPWTSYRSIKLRSSSIGTVTKVLTNGVVVHFFANVKGFIPKSELADAFVQDPQSSFPLGKSVRVIAKDVDAGQEKLILSARSAFEIDHSQQLAFEALDIGEIVEGVITAKSDSDVIVDLKPSGIRASIRKGHLTDGSTARNTAALKKLRLGQTMSDLVLVEKFEKRHSVVLSNKSKLVKAAQAGTLPLGLSDIRVAQDIVCYVRQITQTGVFVQIAGGVVGLLPITQIPEDVRKLPELGLAKDATVTARVIGIDKPLQRFTLSLLDPLEKTNEASPQPLAKSAPLQNPVDGKTSSLATYAPGYETKAKVSSIKDTQVNVELADGVQGRIDVSEMFDSLSDIKDRKHPLRTFKLHQIISVRVLGIHDARNHRFLPISHRQGKMPVFELSAKGPDHSLATIEEVKPGSSYLGFVNNISNSSLWVHISPNVRGRVQLLDIATDPSILQNLSTHYPIGAAVTVTVKSVDLATARLDFCLKADGDQSLRFEEVHTGMSLAGRVTKTTERSIMVQLSESLAGQVGLTDIADDFDVAKPSTFRKNQVVRVSVVKVDKANKRIFLTTRPSKVLSSSLPVRDRLLSDVGQIKANDVLRGFVKRVADVGLFVSLGTDLTAFVRVSELSDSYIKDWKSRFEIDRLVRGKVIAVDEASQHVQLSLKDSVVSGNYMAPLTFDDIVKGQIVTGRVRKVEDYGAFVVIDNSQNVSGLCHRSEMADGSIKNAKEVLSEGDRVKAKILTVNPEKRKVSFGLKPSYFGELVQDEVDSEDVVMDRDDEQDLGDIDFEDEDEDEDEEDDDDEDDAASIGGIDLESGDESEQDNDPQDSLLNGKDTGLGQSSKNGLDAGGFNWNEDEDGFSGTEMEPQTNKIATSKPKKRKPRIKTDETGALDDNQPQSKDDFERLLLTDRDDSRLWMRYMAFHLDLGEVEQARALADRAVRTIHIREQKEKFNIWVAFLNLESAYGSDESLDQAFAQACQHSDVDDVHTALVDIHIQNNNYKKADELFEIMAGKKSFRANPRFWESYATFLFDKRREPNRARLLLDRGLKSVLAHDALPLTKTFAILEFKRETGDPERGRTLFEGLFTTYPKKWDLWSILIDMEKGEVMKGRGSADNVSALYDRLTAEDKTRNMKPRTAKSIFKQWLQWEEKNGKKKNAEKVKAKAAAFVDRRTTSTT